MTRLPGMAVISISLVLSSAAPLSAQANGARADLVLINGKIWTVNPTRPEVQAVAVWHGRIIKTGNDAEISPLIGPKTRVIDTEGLILCGGSD